MAIYKIPVTILSTGDELLDYETFYIPQPISSPNEYGDGATVKECALTNSSYENAANTTIFVLNKPIVGLIDNRPAPIILKEHGFKHIFTTAVGSYHWIINEQKFLAEVIEIPTDSYDIVPYFTVYLTYISGSYADIYPDFVGKRFELILRYSSGHPLTYPVPAPNGLIWTSTPQIYIKPITGTFPRTELRLGSWNNRQIIHNDFWLTVREVLFNIPKNSTDPDISDKFPEYDPTVSGPTSNPLNPEDNPEIGDFDTESEPIPPPDIDELNRHSAVNTGLISIYNPDIGQVAQLANFLWSDLFSLDTFKKMFGSPMEAILSLHLIPVSPSKSAGDEVVIGNVNTGITMPKVTQQFISHHCGAVKIQSFFGSALDFSPFTKMSIFLPFIGVRELDIDEIMYKSVGVQYLFDVLTGACTALITVDGDVMYQFSGSASLQLPINATNWTSVINNIMSLATATIATVASSGAAAGQLLTAGANAVTSSKMSIERSGAVTGAAGFLGVQTPYLIRTIPRQSLAKNYQHYSGYPSNITVQLGSLSGYTEVEQVFLDGVTATEAEKTEILSLLKGGVII